MTPDDLHDPAWRRLLHAARRRLERTGGVLDGTISLSEPTDAERRVIIGVTGTYRSASANLVRVPLTALDEWLRGAVGHGLVGVLTLVGDAPLRDRPADRRREVSARAAALAAARRGRHAGTGWYITWLDGLAADGTLTRLIRRGSSDLTDAVTVLDRLPADGVPLPALAETALGDTKALGGTPLAGLVLRALAAWQGAPTPTSAEEERALWDAAGVIVDDLSSQVLVLNLPAREGMVGRWLTEAASAGLPFRLTLHQLRLADVMPTASVVFVCENPAVLRAATASLGSRSAPLICAEGVASVACRRLVAACAEAGAAIRWRNDFDWPGLRMTTAAVERFGATPWRMGAADYLDAVVDGGAPLRGAPAASPWDPALAAAMTRSGRSVMEERLIPRLLADLADLADHADLAGPTAPGTGVGSA